jgi:hypothetical protein
MARSLSGARKRPGFSIGGAMASLRGDLECDEREGGEIDVHEGRV